MEQTALRKRFFKIWEIFIQNIQIPDKGDRKHSGVWAWLLTIIPDVLSRAKMERNLSTF